MLGFSKILELLSELVTVCVNNYSCDVFGLGTNSYKHFDFCLTAYIMYAHIQYDSDHGR